MEWARTCFTSSLKYWNDNSMSICQYEFIITFCCLTSLSPRQLGLESLAAFLFLDLGQTSFLPFTSMTLQGSFFLGGIYLIKYNIKYSKMVIFWNDYCNLKTKNFNILNGNVSLWRQSKTFSFTEVKTLISWSVIIGARLIMVCFYS